MSLARGGVAVPYAGQACFGSRYAKVVDAVVLEERGSARRRRIWQ